MSASMDDPGGEWLDEIMSMTPDQLRESVDKDDIAKALNNLVINQEARRLLHAVPFEPPVVMSAKRLLMEPLPEDPWTISRLMGYGHNVLLAAQFKAGKTTLILNFIRSLVDGRSFLDQFPTALGGDVCYLNYELTDWDMQQWLRDVHVRRASRVWIVNLRQRPNPLMTDEGQAWLVGFMKSHNVKLLVIDTFAASYTGTNHNDNAEVATFTRLLDEIKGRADCPGLLLSHHFGRKDHEQGQEHGHGAVQLDNWADMRWMLTRGDEDRHEERYLRVEGRGDGLDESLLSYDKPSRRLMLAGSNKGIGRTKAGKLSVKDEILDLVREQPGVNGTAVKDAVGGRKQVVTVALKELVDEGLIVSELGPNRSLIYRPGDDETQLINFD